MAQIYDTDSWKVAADKIYREFTVGQSCCIGGIDYLESERRTESRGEMVVKELERLDKLENLRPMGKKMTRKRKKIPNSIGGYVAHKIFRYSHKFVDSDMKYTIWRVQ